MCMKAQKLWLKVCDILTRLTDTFPQISLSEVLFVEYFYLFLFQNCNSCCSCKSCIFHQFSEWILHVSEICIPKTAFWTATEILICTNDIVGGGQPHQWSVEHSSQFSSQLFPILPNYYSPNSLRRSSALLLASSTSLSIFEITSKIRKKWKGGLESVQSKLWLRKTKKRGKKMSSATK